MFLYLQIFLAFFIPGILGYGGGPPSIPLIQNEVVNHYQWLTNAEFAQILAVGNSLPGPIATKLAGFIGYEVGGIVGLLVALFATVGPSLILMLLLMSLLLKHKESPRLKGMTRMIYPVIAIMMAVLMYEFFANSVGNIGWVHTAVLGGASLLLLQRFKIHPAWVIVGSFLYGAFIPLP